ncbi:uncharacterized protein LOC119991504 [Tripterygium wilfordii]|uniref:uncharacterized protein LOC119991504 n=1 Tax=Tripterygium wilfordii TaxID=458696 RepID=UPI0018F83A76|nr:uncharacterized protein LOC119991504 [Tripterygium wilfordii]
MTSPWNRNVTSGFSIADEYEQNQEQSSAWVRYTQTDIGSSYKQASSYVNLNLIPEMCMDEDDNHFEQAIANNEFDLVEDEPGIHTDDSDDDEEDGGNVGLNIDSGIDNENGHINLEEMVPEFGDVSQAEYAVCRDWDKQNQGPYDTLAEKEVFENKKELIRAVKMWHIQNNSQYKTQRSSKSELQLICMKEPICNWYLRAMKKENFNLWMITVIKGRHTCTNASLHHGHRQLDAEYIADEVIHIVKADLKINIAAIQAYASSHLKYPVSYRKAWVAKQKVMEKLFGTFEDSYNMLPRFLQALQISNPGSIVNLNYKECVNGVATFGRVFWAFRPSIEGFHFCRPLISIDGTHLYGKYKGKLLIAVAFDADNGLFPLCYAIVDEESSNNWGWFIDNIRSYVTNRPGICVLSDRHAGILAAMRDRWPEPVAYHRYCSRHFVSNFHDKFKDVDMKNAVNLMANEPSRQKFDLWMSRVKDINIVAWNYLDRAGKEKWSLSYDDGHRYGNMTTNMSEIFNSVLKGGRFLPITALVQLTFYRCNKYFVKRRMEAEQYRLQGSELPPQVYGHISRENEDAKRQHVRMFNHDPPTFQVTTRTRGAENNQRGERRAVVCLGERPEDQSCSCNMWLLYHRPCSHVLACCSVNKIDWRQYMEAYFTIGAYESSYAPIFCPIPDESGWQIYSGPVVIADPDQRRSSKGRPKSTRIRNEMDAREGRSSNKCSICGQRGHNKKSHKSTAQSGAS